MSKYDDVSDKEKINMIKRSLAVILKEISSDNKNLDKYFKNELKLVVPELENVSMIAGDELNATVVARNEAKIKAAEEQNAKLTEEFEIKKRASMRIIELATQMKPVEGCLCGDCYEAGVIGSSLPQEMEYLIDAARSMARTNDNI